MTKYMAAGAFAPHGRAVVFANSAYWLKVPTPPATFGGKLYGVPYYAGSRVVTYRKDLFTKAGVKKPPTSLAQFTHVAQRIAQQNKAKGFSPVYIAGTRLVRGPELRLRLRRTDRARSKGKWEGKLDSPRSIAGLTAFKKFFPTASRASKSTTRQAVAVRGVRPGQAASMIGPRGSAAASETSTRASPARSSCRATRRASRCRGSSAARSRRAHRRQQGPGGGLDQGVHGHGVAAGPPGEGQHPQRHEPAREQCQRTRCLRSWFVPNAKNWVNVENGNIIRNMLTQILTNKLTVKQAASSASDNITSVLNG